MMFAHDRKLLRTLDAMLDEALAGTFEAQSYDESLLSKIETKMAKLLEQSQLRYEGIESERERVRSLVSDISHQTRTPLANVTLYAQLLAEQDLTEKEQRFVAQITESAEKLDFLIRSLVKISRLESGIIRIEPVPGDVRELAHVAVRECEGLAASKGIELSEPQDGAPVEALFDQRWCAEALFNIVENAVKYTPESGRVSVSIIEYEMFVCIDVTDTGQGISEENLPKLFGRFWRASASSENQGVGIGLYLAREIIMACGGYIKVESRIGEGSTFSVFLSKV